MKRVAIEKADKSGNYYVIRPSQFGVFQFSPDKKSVHIFLETDPETGENTYIELTRNFLFSLRPYIEAQVHQLSWEIDEEEDGKRLSSY